MNILLPAFCLFCPVTLLAQAPFVNLDFESTTVPYLTNQWMMLPAAQAFPGWTVWETNSIRDQVGYNTFLTPGSHIELTATGFRPLGALGDLFMARFHSRTDSDCSLSQVGTIPSDANALRFRIGKPFDIDQVVVTFDGQTLSPVVVWSQPPLLWTLEADISAFAGVTGELRFTVRGVFEDGLPRAADLNLDDIQFIPEPGTWSLLGVGTLALWCLKRRKAR
jgi:hypothetical protein